MTGLPAEDTYDIDHTYKTLEILTRDPGSLP